ncbi:phytoene/squalene synthase family protein [Streptomyces sp. NPDC050264]|uniref:phytoene/squalene synthase family protein n=1 Tax=Streptomyces sp. NPDC050264 TaxID=3155038 RepID=UPI00341D0C74
MTARELDAAGITDPDLRHAYAYCRKLNARHGKTYFLATRLLPAHRRPAVHALYGFARWADDIVDSHGSRLGRPERAAALEELSTSLRQGLSTRRSTEPVVHALADTADRYAIDPRHFHDFMTAMRDDLTVTDYPTYADLCRYMHGSAGVIGLQMLPVLGSTVPRTEAEPYAAALGVAFQLTNFLRDVGEDLDRGRVYLPADLLHAHGVDRDHLQWSRDTCRRDIRITRALKAFEALTRDIYRQAVPGIALLAPVSRPCVRSAFVLYSGILDAVADDGYSVLHRRAVVSRRRRAVVALDGLARIVHARISHRSTPMGSSPRPGEAGPAPALTKPAAPVRQGAA